MIDTQTLAPEDPLYPKLVLSAYEYARAAGTMSTRAEVLYLRGALPLELGIAIVGTRLPSEIAVEYTRQLVQVLAAAGFSIWSGGARGIDAAAHRAALRVGAKTVVVLGAGLDEPYPKEHEGLFGEVLACGGALLARVPDCVPPMRSGFIARNRVLAAATVASVVIQAGLISGARSTASFARKLGRPLWVVPHAPWDPKGAGCVAELANGAHMLRDGKQIIDHLVSAAPAWVECATTRPRAAWAKPKKKAPRHMSRPDPAQESLPLALSAEEGRIWAGLAEKPKHFDEICESSGLSASSVTSLLLTLTLRAVVVEAPAGFYRRKF